MNNSHRRVWVTWEQHRRTRELARSIKDVQLFEIESSAPRLIRYMILLFRTLLILIKQKPQLVFVQSPSNILALFMVTIGRFFVNRVIIDAHNGGVRPFGPQLQYLTPLFAYIHRKADICIITNQALSNVIRNNGGTPFILEDKLPSLSGDSKKELKNRHNVVSICTFEADEPFQEVINAGRHIDPAINIFITGNYKKINKEIIDNSPPNVIFTGFLPDDEYVALLASCNAIIDLTLEPDCLVCGAYEAVTLEKPIILSDAPALRNYFNKGVVFTKNHAEQIAASVTKILAEENELVGQIQNLKKRITKDWQNKINDFEKKLSNL